MTLSERIALLDLNANSVHKVKITGDVTCEVLRGDGKVIVLPLADYLTGITQDIADLARALGADGLAPLANDAPQPSSSPRPDKRVRSALLSLKPIYQEREVRVGAAYLVRKMGGVGGVLAYPLVLLYCSGKSLEAFPRCFFECKEMDDPEIVTWAEINEIYEVIDMREELDRQFQSDKAHWQKLRTLTEPPQAGGEQ